MLIGRNNWSRHRPWLIFALSALAGMSVVYAVGARGSSDWPGGSSLVGFSFGVLGGLIILFECFLWARKNLLRTWRIGPTQDWMRAHIWLGLLALPLLIYHSGFRLGGTLTSVLMILLVTVVASGVWGLALQQVLPRFMLNRLPAETIYSQIDNVAKQLSEQALLVVKNTCGPDLESTAAKPVSYLTIGTVRTAGKVRGKVIQTRVADSPIPETEALRSFFQATVDPFLRGEGIGDSPLRLPSQASTLFENLRARIPPEAHSAVNSLEELCEQRRQLESQSRAHFWLHCWLWVHLPLSAALLLLMGLHAFYAVRYW